jgi:hypothetical protein
VTELVKNWNHSQNETIKVNNQGTHFGDMRDAQRDTNKLGYAQLARQTADSAASRGLQAQGLDLQRRKMDMERSMGAPIQARDRDSGEAVLVHRILSADGGVEFRQERLPPNLDLPKQQADPRIIQATADSLYGKPTGRTVAGKPEVYNEDTAYAKAYAQYNGSGGARSGMPSVKPPEPTPPRGLQPNAQSAINQQWKSPYTPVERGAPMFGLTPPR